MFVVTMFCLGSELIHSFDTVWYLLLITCSVLYSLQSKLHFVTVLGSGLLVGTALAVIIPEGVNALYEESSHRMYILFEECIYYMLVIA